MRVEAGTSQASHEGETPSREGGSGTVQGSKSAHHGRRQQYDKVSFSKEARGLARQLETHRSEGAVDRSDYQAHRLWQTTELHTKPAAENAEGARRIEALERQVDRLLRRLLNEQPFAD